MNYNPKTLESLGNTWIYELLSISDEEIKNEMDGLPQISRYQSKTNTETAEGSNEITFPHLLGEMSQYEKALFVLWKKKDSQHKEICEKEHSKHFKGNFSPEHEELHRVMPILSDEMWNSINGRFPDAPGDSKTISQGGQIFATKEQEDSLKELTELLFGKAFPSHNVVFKIVH